MSEGSVSPEETTKPAGETTALQPPKLTQPRGRLLSRRNLLLGLAGAALGVVAGEIIDPKIRPALFHQPPMPTRAPELPTPTPAPEPTSTPQTDAPGFFPEIPYGAGHIKNVESKDQFADIEKVPNPENLDPAYIKELVVTLEKEKGTIKERMEAIIDNLYKIGGPTGNGTALMIDESGIFLTAAHTMGALPKQFEPLNRFFISLTTDPRTEKAFLVRQFMVMENNDVGVVYAPTGKARKPVANLQIDTFALQDNTKLWSYGIFTREKDGVLSYTLGLVSGQVGEVQKEGEMGYDDLLQIRDMIPYGGLSGAPVVSREGKIVGTISGGLPYGDEKTPFSGAAVSKIDGMKKLADKGNATLYSIPLTSSAK